MNIDITKLKKQNIIALSDKLDSAGFKLVFLNQVVDWYKARKDQKKDLEEKLTEFESNHSNEKDIKVDYLDKISNRLDYEINKFEQISRHKKDTISTQMLKESRISFIFNKLKNLPRPTGHKLNGANTNSPLMDGNIVLWLSFIITILSLLTFVISSEGFILLLGAALLIFNIFNFLLINLAISDDFSKMFNLQLNYNEPQKGYEDFVREVANAKEDEVIVNKAWLNALVREKERVANAMNLNSNKNDQLDEEAIKNQLAEINEYLISSSEYLKIRREIDILEIEVGDSNESINPEMTLTNTDNLEKSFKMTIMNLMEYSSDKLVINMT